VFHTGRKYPFIEAFTNGAPADPGVYVLWRNDVVIYIGRAQGAPETIHSRLQDHFNGRLCSCSRQATHYSWEISFQGRTREREMLDFWLAQTGKVPACNLHARNSAAA
jgi:hypothetical protein